MWILYALALIVLSILLLHWLSYRLIKQSILTSRTWDLNICCGETDGGGINADIVPRSVDNFLEVDIYDLPFADKSLGAVLCSHTIEHVEDPDAFYAELQRVGREVVVVIPPLWDLAAVFNVWEHRWIFLSLRKKHAVLPRRVALPLAKPIQEKFGQRINA